MYQHVALGEFLKGRVTRKLPPKGHAIAHLKLSCKILQAATLRAFADKPEFSRRYVIPDLRKRLQREVASLQVKKVADFDEAKRSIARRRQALQDPNFMRGEPHGGVHLNVSASELAQASRGFCGGRQRERGTPSCPTQQRILTSDE